VCADVILSHQNYLASDDGSDFSRRRRISTRSWTSSSIYALAGMGFNVTPFYLFAVVIKGRTLDARLHDRQHMDVPICIFTRNHLHRHDADVQSSAGTSPHFSFLDVLLR
jgi:hypothetical protein